MGFELWINNAVVLSSTVLGVYLAARAGYRTAVDVSVINQLREGYYLRRALCDEVKDNLDTVDRWMDNYIKDGWRYRGDASRNRSRLPQIVFNATSPMRVAESPTAICR